MKARIKLNNQLTNKQRAEMREYIREVTQQDTKDNIRRFMKIVCVALHEKFGFGHDRLAVVMGEIDSLAEEQKDDPVFWSHIDRVMHQLDLPFLDEDYDKMGE